MLSVNNAKLHCNFNNTFENEHFFLVSCYTVLVGIKDSFWPKCNYPYFLELFCEKIKTNIHVISINTFRK